MKTAEDFRKALGDADASFDRCVRGTLNALSREEETMKKRHVGLVVVLCVVLACAVALAAANQWGFMDFAARWGFIDQETMDHASQLLQTEVPQEGGETSWCSFTVREVLADGNDAYLVVAVKPKRDDIMLVGEWCDLESPVSNVGHIFDDADMTLAEYAEANGKTVVAVSLDDVDFSAEEGVTFTQDGQMESDGTYAMMMRGPCTSERVKQGITLSCYAVPWLADGSIAPEDEWGKTLLTFSSNAAALENAADSAQGADFPSAGVRIDQVTATDSELSRKFVIRYSVTDAERFAEVGNDVWFELLGTDGTAIRTSEDTWVPVDESRTAFVQTLCCMGAQDLPEVLTVQARTLTERFETCTLPMK